MKTVAEVERATSSWVGRLLHEHPFVIAYLVVAVVAWAIVLGVIR